MAKKIVVKAVVAVILTLVIGLISNSLMPILGNDVALLQLQNYDDYFVAMNVWHNIQNGLNVAVGIVWVVTACLIGRDIYKGIKNKKETT